MVQERQSGSALAAYTPGRTSVNKHRLYGSLYFRYTLLMLDEKQKNIGVIAASAGNHALALAYHGGQLSRFSLIKYLKKFITIYASLYISDIPVTVVMPVVAPIMKVENCKKFGATVIVHGDNIGESRKLALQIGKDKGLMYING